MNDLVLRAGGFLTKSWYTKIPTYLVHDIPFLHLVDTIAKKFGINNVSKELTEKIGEGYEEAKKIGKGDDYVEKSVNIIKQSKDINEFVKKSQKITADTLGAKKMSNTDIKINTQNADVKKLDKYKNINADTQFDAVLNQ
jgi:hypothetical protein